jgi:hypothetical protein
VRYNVKVCGRSLAGTTGSNPAGGISVLLLSFVCQVEVNATGRFLVQRRTTDCGESLSVIRKASDWAKLSPRGLLSYEK